MHACNIHTLVYTYMHRPVGTHACMHTKIRIDTYAAPGRPTELSIMRPSLVALVASAVDRLTITSIMSLQRIVASFTTWEVHAVTHECMHTRATKTTNISDADVDGWMDINLGT